MIKFFDIKNHEIFLLVISCKSFLPVLFFGANLNFRFFSKKYYEERNDAFREFEKVAANIEDVSENLQKAS